MKQKRHRWGNTGSGSNLKWKYLYFNDGLWLTWKHLERLCKPTLTHTFCHRYGYDLLTVRKREWSPGPASQYSILSEGAWIDCLKVPECTSHFPSCTEKHQKWLSLSCRLSAVLVSSPPLTMSDQKSNWGKTKATSLSLKRLFFYQDFQKVRYPLTPNARCVLCLKNTWGVLLHFLSGSWARVTSTLPARMWDVAVNWSQ